MTKVITYGTFDLLHLGHIRLLQRAKALGDYLIVGITADDFDKARGKINVQQSLMERVEAVRATELADQIIIEEYEGQKIDDIQRYDVDIFTVGTDWVGKFDYLREYCKVVYLERTEGVSSSDLRSEKRKLKLGIVGETRAMGKFVRECVYVNGIEAGMALTKSGDLAKEIPAAESYGQVLEASDAVYIASMPQLHAAQVRQALEKGKHVLCESPVALSRQECGELFRLADEKGCVLMTALKTAYSTAYSRLLLLVKSGRIGDVYAVDATCTSLREMGEDTWNSICEWGPTAMLPIFHLLGTNYTSKRIVSHLDGRGNDEFTRVQFLYDHAVASMTVGQGVKSEGELVISGTKGYIYVPAPWWKTEYFEIRYEDQSQNKRYFYQLDGEGIRYELIAFAKAVETGKKVHCIDESISQSICEVIEDFDCKRDFTGI